MVGTAVQLRDEFRFIKSGAVKPKTNFIHQENLSTP
jgi:hypothetical protein